MSNLPHGWKLVAAPEIRSALLREFVRPAVRAIPSSMARQIGECTVSLATELGGPDITSQLVETSRQIEICVASGNREAHDIAIELLLCVGQALWVKLPPGQRRAYWKLLDTELRAGVDGEIDADALEQKQILLNNRFSARSRRRLLRYGAASFAATAAEYIHCLWHDVSLRQGPEHLVAPCVRRRLELLACWYPPDRSYRLFPRSRGKANGKPEQPE